ncbi:MAG: sensor histidine kinase [Desulfobacteraceae bacterium]|nr:sensor histidine kinase [Desulfobacteraceae bacterium]
MSEIEFIPMRKPARMIPFLNWSMTIQLPKSRLGRDFRLLLIFLYFVIPCLKKGKMVQVEIEDNGPGMDEKIRHKKGFDPSYMLKALALWAVGH